MIGFAYTIQQRLVAAEAQAANSEAEQPHAAAAGAAGPSVSLVLADRAALVDSAVADAYPRLRNGAHADRCPGAGSLRRSCAAGGPISAASGSGRAIAAALR